MKKKLNKRETSDLEWLVQEGLCFDGDHHKQCFLEEIGRLFEIDLPEHDEGMAPETLDADEWKDRIETRVLN